MATVWDNFSDPVSSPADGWDAISDPVGGGKNEPHRGATPAKIRQSQAAMQQMQAEDRARMMPVDPYVPGGADWNGNAPALEGSAAVPEAALSMATGAVATPVAGLAGLASTPFATDPAAVIRRVQEALTYSPRTQGGQQVAGVVAYPFEKLAQGADAAGEFVRRTTGSPLLATGVNTAIQAAPALLLDARVRNGVRRSDRVGSSAAADTSAASVPAVPKVERPAGLGTVLKDPPTLDELRTLKNDAYKRAEDTGVVVTRAAANRLKMELVNDLKKEGINRKLHPKASAAADEIVNSKGQLSLTQIETLRKIANDARTSMEPADARLGSKIVEKIDDFEATLGEGDVIAGDPAAATAFKEARALNARYAKASVIKKIFDDAEVTAGANYTMSGMENALRQQFKALAKNDRKLRGFTAEEKAAIRKVAIGGPMENALRMLGKFAPTGVMPTLTGLGAISVGGPAGFMVPAAGTVGRYAATRMTIRNAKDLDRLVRRGPENFVEKAKKPVPANE